VLSSHDLQQLVASPTHRLGHTLDLFITHTDLIVNMLPIYPPLLSDHSFIIADVNCPRQSVIDTLSSHQPIREWRLFDVDAFTEDLMRSDLVADVSEAIAFYNTTLRSLLDKHVPLRPGRVRVRATARWYDHDCRIMKRTTRRLERLYRRLHSTESLSAWRDQFDRQRSLFQSKFSAFWSETMTSSRNNSCALWKAANSMLAPPRQSSSTKLKVDEFATFFRDKVDAIRFSTSMAEPPAISTRSHPALSTSSPVTIAEVTALLSNAVSKSCDLDPIPTWLLKRLFV
jgi:hypothetical protein